MPNPLTDELGAERYSRKRAEEALAEAQRQRQNAQSRTNNLRREIWLLQAEVKRLRDEQPERVELERKLASAKAGGARRKYNGEKAEARVAELEALLEIAVSPPSPLSFTLQAEIRAALKGKNADV